MEFRRQLPPEYQSQPQKGLLFRLHLDAPLLAALLLLTALGLLVLYSAADEGMAVMTRQGIRLAVGFSVLVMLAQIPPRTYRFWSPAAYGAGVALLALVLLLGAEAQGAQRWLNVFGLFSFQPTEIMKVAVPAMMAWYFSTRSLPPRARDVAVALGLTLAPAVLIAMQPDLGSALLIAASGLIVIFLAGLSWRLIATGLALILIAAPLTYFFALQDYQRERVHTFLNPQSDRLGAGWNIIQSQTAIGSGGLTGKGWLNGTQSRLDFLPESTTDFILAVLGEEQGLLGVTVLLALYLFILGRCFWISARGQDTYSRLLAGAFTVTFFVYVFVNMGMASGLLPVVGIPLPLVSYGGSSLVTLLAAFGMLMSIHTHRKLLGT
jgi:rod shape determining protein RodA